MTQDDAREIQIAAHCGLTQCDSRTGTDALDVRNNPFEIKSVTKDKGVSTARQVHLDKIAKWKKHYWIFAKGPKSETGMEIRELYIAHPDDLEPFFQRCRDKITSTLNACQPVIAAARTQGIDTTFVEKYLEVGSRLDDPNIPWGLVKETMPLPANDSEETRHLIELYTAYRPLAEKGFTTPE